MHRSLAVLSLALVGTALCQPMAVSPVTNVHVQARARWVEVAQMAYVVGMWDDVANAMKNAALLDANLSEDERLLLTAGYFKVAKPRMDAIDGLSLFGSLGLAEAAELQLLEQYSDSLQSRLQALCRDFITLIDTRLLPTAVSLRNADAKDFWLLVRAKFQSIAQDPAGYAEAKAVIEQLCAVEELIALQQLGKRVEDGQPKGGRPPMGPKPPMMGPRPDMGIDMANGLFGAIERAWNSALGGIDAMGRQGPMKGPGGMRGDGMRGPMGMEGPRPGMGRGGPKEA